MQFVARWWFLAVLALLLGLGFGFSQELAGYAAGWPQKPIVAAVLFVMALPLEAGTMWRAVRRPQAVLLAVAINYGLLPLAAWPVGRWLLPETLGIGLLVAASVPTTLASAAVWTRRAGGNDSIALFVTMITNVSCFLVTPFWVFTTTGAATSLRQTPTEMVLELAMICVLPVVAAQLLRLYGPLGAWAKEYKTALGNLAQCGILSIVLVGAVKASQEIGRLPPGESVGPAAWAAMLAAVTGVHLGMLWVGHVLGAWLGLPREDRIAVGFSGSQKTLMVGIHIASGFGGLAILPMVAFHVCQLLVDTLVADRLLKAGPARTPASPPDPAASRPAGRHAALDPGEGLPEQPAGNKL